MKNILVLGHKGMLGNAVFKYFSAQKEKYAVLTTNERWGSKSFEGSLTNLDVDVIVNCIGIIPQKKPAVSDYEKINIDLPIFLESLNKKVVHPSTDCEFSGNIQEGKKYKKTDIRDADDDYGKSKAVISTLIETSFKNTKIIRTSIIGHEMNSHLSLLDWFLNSECEARGYTNHYWNGITTLEWAKLCEKVIDSWENFPVLNQYGTPLVASKYEVLNMIKKVYEKNIVIIPFEAPQSIDKCLESDSEIAPLVDQLRELKDFYYR